VSERHGQTDFLMQSVMGPNRGRVHDWSLVSVLYYSYMQRC